jgi:hypothetical protein
MTFEAQLFADKLDAGGKPRTPAEQLEEFRADCRAIFSTQQGRRVLAKLCGVAHPLRHSPGMSEHEHGRAEVVATLWRFGSSDRAID